MSFYRDLFRISSLSPIDQKGKNPPTPKPVGPFGALGAGKRTPGVRRQRCLLSLARSTNIGW